LTHFITFLGFFLLILDFLFILDFIPLINKLDHNSVFYFPPKIMLFYGLYFSILVRDCTEGRFFFNLVCSDQMANSLEKSRFIYNLN
jgi:hypothetical protein